MWINGAGGLLIDTASCVGYFSIILRACNCGQGREEVARAFSASDGYEGRFGVRAASLAENTNGGLARTGI
jgi:hypothetical protein